MYKVNFVNDEEFDNLPGKDMYSKLGVAYPEYGQAFVRKTGSNLVDVFNMAHELEHLQGNDLDEHYDAENKCYYKNNSWIAPVAIGLGSMLFPGVGTALGGMLGGAGSSIGGALSSMGMGGLASGLSSTVGAGLNSLGSGIAGAGAGLRGALGMGGGGGGAAGAAGEAAGSASGMGASPIANLGTGIGQAGAGTAAASTGAGAGAGAGMGGSIGNALKSAGNIGNAMSMVNQGSQMFNQPKAPDMSSIMQQFNQQPSMAQQPQTPSPNVIMPYANGQNYANSQQGSQQGYYSGRNPMNGFMPGVA